MTQYPKLSEISIDFQTRAEGVMKYVIWGAGGFITELGDIFNKRVLQKIDYFVDSDSNKWGAMFLGKPVKSPESLSLEDKKELAVIVGTYETHSEIELHLRKMGIVNYSWIATYVGSKDFPAIIKRKPWFVTANSYYTNERYIYRTELALELVRWEKTHSMLDLGAGMMHAKKFLPESCAYFPVDCEKLAPEIVVRDFNRYEFPEQTADLVYAVGVLGYVADWRWFLDQMASAVNKGGSLIVSTIILSKRQALSTPHISFPVECDVILQLQGKGMILKAFRDWNTDARIMLFDRIDDKG
jgi:hypothetical protein